MKEGIIHMDCKEITKSLERLNKIKQKLYKGKDYYYDEGIKPENRCRNDEYPDSC